MLRQMDLRVSDGRSLRLSFTYRLALSIWPWRMRLIANRRKQYQSAFWKRYDASKAARAYPFGSLTSCTGSAKPVIVCIQASLTSIGKLQRGFLVLDDEVRVRPR